MKDEILACLKNAMGRGESTEKAAQSLINAGYNSQEVRETARFLSEGASNIIYREEKTDDKIQNKENFNQPRSAEKKKWRAAFIIMIIFVMLLLLGSLSYLIYILTR